MDTGADVTVLPEENYQPGRDGALETTMRKLSDPVGISMDNVIGVEK